MNVRPASNSATATASLNVTNQQMNVQLSLQTNDLGDSFVTNGWQILNGGEGYTQYSTLTITGQDYQSPYGDKTVLYSLALDGNGSNTAASGGENEQWYGPPRLQPVKVATRGDVQAIYQ